MFLMMVRYNELDCYFGYFHGSMVRKMDQLIRNFISLHLVLGTVSRKSCLKELKPLNFFLKNNSCFRLLHVIVSWHSKNQIWSRPVRNNNSGKVLSKPRIYICCFILRTRERWKGNGRFQHSTIFIWSWLIFLMMLQTFCPKFQINQGLALEVIGTRM
jgi:hypothetical protein